MNDKDIMGKLDKVLCELAREFNEEEIKFSRINDRIISHLRSYEGFEDWWLNLDLDEQAKIDLELIEIQKQQR